MLLRSTAGTLDSDDAVVGLMAKHAAHGEIPVLFWGQNYGGPQEVLLTAPLFALFGTSTILLLLVPAVLTAAASVVVWRIGLRLSNTTSAVAAALILWVAPGYLIYKTSHQHGFYASGLLWSAVLLLVVLRLATRPSRLDAALLGLVLGAAWWQTPQILPVAVPALIWLACSRPRVLRLAWLVALTALVGALPWLGWNAVNGWSSVTDTPGYGEAITPGTYVDHVRQYVNALMPMSLNLRTPFTSDWPIGAVPAALIYASLLCGFAWIGWRGRRRPISLLVAVMAGYPLIYAASPASWNAAEPRYLLLALPAVALLLAYPLRTRGTAAIGIGVTCLLSALVLTRMDDSFQLEPGITNPRSFAPLVAELDRRRINRVWTTYWIAYRLTFETDERIIAAHVDLTRSRTRAGRLVIGDAGWSRNWDYNRAVRADPKPAVVFIHNSAPSSSNAQLRRHGFRRVTVGDFDVYVAGETNRLRIG